MSTSLLRKTSGFRVGYEYANGQMTAVRNMENNALLWKMDAVNAMGQITKSSLGNDLKRLCSYDDYHLPSRIVLDNGSFPYDQINYTFNATTGNLSQRNNETYGYDNLNRLVSVGLNGANTMTLSYLDNGNMASKSDVGDYQYADGNHAVSAITNQAAGYNPPALDMTYTSYNRVSSITQQGSVTRKLNLYYGPDNQRRKTQYYENGVLKKTTYFVGDYEKEGLKEFDYIYTPEGMAAVAVKEQNNTRVIYYTHTDHLGSVRVYTQSGSSSPSALYDYDAWGKRTFRGGSLDQFSRGYLGQEHLPEFGLINLNARMYDPVLGRFLGIDPYVQAPDFTQSHNRYVYGLNNPMRYVDPDGEFWQFIVAAVFLYAMTARENSAYYDENGVKTYPDSPLHWQWNPTKWEYWEVTVGGNTDGSNPYANVSAGSPNSPMITVGYQQGKGVGVGTTYKGNTNLYHHYGDNKYVRNFAKANFGNQIKGVTIYADGSYSNGKITFDEDGFAIYQGEKLAGVYVGNSDKGIYELHIYKHAFESPEELYLTIGHEYLHHALRNSGLDPKKEQEWVIREWEYEHALNWGYPKESIYIDRWNSHGHWWADPNNPSFRPYLRVRQDRPKYKF